MARPGPTKNDKSRVGAAPAKAKKTSGFLADFRYRNDLPPPPIDPKHIKLPSNPDKLVQYHRTTLEQNYQYRLHMDPMIGLTVNIIDPRTAEDDEVEHLSAADKHLIRREADEDLDYYGKDKSGIADALGIRIAPFANPISLRNIAESSKVRSGKHWLRKTEYIDNKMTDTTLKTISGSYENERRAAEVEKEHRLLSGNADRLSKTERIEASFQHSKQVPVHETRSDLKPVKVFTLLPNMELAKNRLFGIQFTDENLLRESVKPSDEGVLASGRKGAKYTDEQLALLQSSILEQVNPEDDSRISLLVPALKNDEIEAEKLSKSIGNNESEDVEPVADNNSTASKSEPLDNDDKEKDLPKDNLQTMKWLRDYEYSTRTADRHDRFALVWKTEEVQASKNPEKILCGTVTFCEMEPLRMEMSRSQSGKYDIEESKRKRIKLIRREYTASESQEIDSRLFELTYGPNHDDDLPDNGIDNDAGGTADKSDDSTSIHKSVKFDLNETSGKAKVRSRSATDDDEEEFGEEIDSDTPANKD